MPSSAARVWIGATAILVLVFLSSVARFHHPQFGFTALIVFNSGSHQREVRALQGLPHYEYGGDQAYDGAYYAQLALEPLLRDPAIDGALDNPPYRARRILFSWTARALGLGRPAWILQAYALQNVLAWLLLGWVLIRWIPPTSGRCFALWSAVMFSHGLLASIRLAVLDGPSLLLIAIAVAAAERQRTWTAAAIVGVAGLGRETNLSAGVALPLPRGWRGWLRLAGAAIVVVAPLLLWQDYLWSIYRGSSTSAGIEHITPPLVAFGSRWQTTVRDVWATADFVPVSGLLVLIALTSQVVLLCWLRQWRDAWWRVAVVYAALMLVAHPAVWDGHPGAITRVVLPLTCAVNILLVRVERGFWLWYAFANLHLLAAARVLPFPWMPRPF